MASQQVETVKQEDRDNLMGIRFEAREIGGEGSSMTAAHYHSALAMQAAKKMRRTRQKLKTGQEVCHHLRMMLSSEPVRSQPQPAGQQPQISLGF